KPRLAVSVHDQPLVNGAGRRTTPPHGDQRRHLLPHVHASGRCPSLSTVSTPNSSRRISPEAASRLSEWPKWWNPRFTGGRPIRGLHEMLHRSTALVTASRRAGVMEEPRKLYRSRTQRMVAGVCGGLAEYFN